ncbi:myosin regulatory light chain 2, skeletal muscle isoform type 1-like [Thunnus maccoyii]|uniref:myosin regulatory light chain 2, skeletal muscle isoform type 1-like n=1 Tax=Thunnus maccoyii TaxID=8240 RepID=UPI001C4AB424|nr:myosin regulatory light chain 2, skeletal muscle isoform type 1-like [Thunnus maccoyii]
MTNTSCLKKKQLKNTLAYFISRTPRPEPKCLPSLKVPGRPTDSQQASQKGHSSVETQTNAATSKCLSIQYWFKCFFLCFGQEDSVKLHSTTRAGQAPKKAKKKEGGGSGVVSMFEHNQIQEFKECLPGAALPLLVNCVTVLSLQAFSTMVQNRDDIIDKSDLRDTVAALGGFNVSTDELDEMMNECPDPVNFTLFLNMKKLKGTDPQEMILSTFKVFDPEGAEVLGGMRLNITSCHRLTSLQSMR